MAGVFLSLPSPYLVTTPDLVIVEANQAYLATVGRTRRELVGQDAPPSRAGLPPDTSLVSRDNTALAAQRPQVRAGDGLPVRSSRGRSGSNRARSHGPVPSRDRLETPQ